jgi:hypothetical protein
MAFDGPRLRRDLVSTILQEDGVRCVDVYDPNRDSSFRLFDYEYSVALAFDGRPLAKIIPWVRLSTGLDLTAEQLTAFAERLDQLGFLASDEDGTPEITQENDPGSGPAARFRGSAGASCGSPRKRDWADALAAFWTARDCRRRRASARPRASRGACAGVAPGDARGSNRIDRGPLTRRDPSTRAARSRGDHARRAGRAAATDRGRAARSSRNAFLRPARQRRSRSRLGRSPLPCWTKRRRRPLPRLPCRGPAG